MAHSPSYIAILHHSASTSFVPKAPTLDSPPPPPRSIPFSPIDVAVSHTLSSKYGHSAELCHMRAHKNYHQGNLKTAKHNLELALYADASHFKANWTFGCLLYDLGEYDQSYHHFACAQSHLKRNANASQLQYNLAISKLGMGEYKESERFLTQAVLLEPTTVLYFEARAFTYRRMNIVKKAITDYKLAWALKKNLIPGCDSMTFEQIKSAVALLDLSEIAPEHSNQITSVHSELDTQPLNALRLDLPLATPNTEQITTILHAPRTSQSKLHLVKYLSM